MERHFPDPSILLHPQIPKPLHLLNPRTIFGKEWWDVQRQIAYKKHNYCCWACGIEKENARYHQWLEAHEFYDINYKTGEVIFIELIALCHSCHNFIHKGRMLMILGSEEMPRSKYDYILNSRFRILKENHLEEPVIYSNCKWEDWHLIINGKNYGQRFKSFEEWQDYFRTNDSREE